MSVTYGFYNSINGDRKYDATHISRIFDGIIVDGVYSTIGTAFIVKSKGGNKLEVGIGRAWFNHTWIYNDAVLPITAPASDTLLGRIDAIVIEINEDESVRENSIKYIKGTPSSQPKRPVMIKTDFVHQYPLCYISRKADNNHIIQADITNMIGTSETPFVTGVLKTIKLDDLVGQWESILNNFVDTQIDEFNSWFNGVKSDMQNLTNQEQQWAQETHAFFKSWFDNIKNQLSEDAAGNLQLQISDHSLLMIKNKIYEIFKSGLESKTVTFTNNDHVIKMVNKDCLLEIVFDETYNTCVKSLYVLNNKIAEATIHLSDTITTSYIFTLPVNNVEGMKIIYDKLLHKED